MDSQLLSKDTKWHIKRSQGGKSQLKGVGVVGRDAKDYNSLKLGASEKKQAVLRPEVIDNLGVEKLETLLQEKIRVKSTDNYSQQSIYKMLGCPKKGITKQALKRKLMEWGINASAADLDALFVKLKYGERSEKKHINASSKRPPDDRVSFPHFIKQVVSADYTVDIDEPLNKSRSAKRPLTKSVDKKGDKACQEFYTRVREMAALQHRTIKQFLAQCVRRLGVGGTDYLSLSMFDDILHSVLKIHWSHDQIRRVFQMHLTSSQKDKISIVKLAEKIERQQLGHKSRSRHMGQSKSLPTIRMDSEKDDRGIRSEIRELEAELALTKRLQKLQEKMKKFED